MNDLTMFLLAAAETVSVESFVWYLIAAIVSMGGGMVWLHRDAITRMATDKKEIKDEFAQHKADTQKTIDTLNTQLFVTLKEGQASELKAAKFEIMAHTPCLLNECPRRSTSFSIGTTAESPLG